MVQDYQNLTLVVGQVFGSEKKNDVSVDETPRNIAEAQVAFKSLFG